MFYKIGFQECHECGEISIYDNQNIHKQEKCAYCGALLIDCDKSFGNINRANRWRSSRTKYIYDTYIKGVPSRERKYNARMRGEDIIPDYYTSECHGCGAVFICGIKDRVKAVCEYCGETLYNAEKYFGEGEKKEQKKWKKARERELYVQYIMGNTENEEKYENRIKLQEFDKRQEQQETTPEEENEKSSEEKSEPIDCPRCGSVNVREVSDVLPAGDSDMFFSGYYCNDCGYKWNA